MRTRECANMRTVAVAYPFSPLISVKWFSCFAIAPRPYRRIWNCSILQFPSFRRVIPGSVRPHVPLCADIGVKNKWTTGRYANMQIFRYTNMQRCKYANTLMSKYTWWALKKNTVSPLRKDPGFRGSFFVAKRVLYRGRPFFMHGGDKEPKIPRGRRRTSRAKPVPGFWVF